MRTQRPTNAPTGAVSKTQRKRPKQQTEELSFDVDVTDSGLTRVSLNEYKGKQRIDIRHYYFNKEKGEYLPTPKGTSFGVDNAKKFVVRMRKLVSKLIEEGIIE